MAMTNLSGTSYNITQLQNATTISDIVTYANDMVGKNLFQGAMVFIFFVFFMSLLRHGVEKALVAASFICLLLSVILNYIGLVNDMMIAVFLILMVVGGVMEYLNKGQ